MRFAGTILLAAVVLGCLGCSETKPPPAPEQTPLTVSDWKALPPEQKYTIDTFERLKAGDPKLYDPAHWDAFNKTVVLPARKKDFPNGFKQP
jgi:hypothetical protein